MTKRVFRSIFMVALVVLLASLTLIMGALYSYFSLVQQDQLRTQTALTAQAAAHEGLEFFQGLTLSDCRITWIAADGTVLYDSLSQSDVMENHLQREEISEALETGFGESSRYSDTLMQRSFYCAQRLPDGTVVRLSVAQQSALTLLIGMAQPILLVIVAATVLSLWLAARLSRKIVRPLNALDLDNPLSNADYDEISPLLQRINSQQRQLRSQQAELQQRKDEFNAVTENMNEGLVLLSARGMILSLNPAAAKLLGAEGNCYGRDFLIVSRSTEIQELVRKALNGKHTERIIHSPAGDYQVDANPVESDGIVSGAVLLLFDVTEKQEAESLRREFTANVSHELKTPLHSISGYAELLKNGMVQPQDIGQFSSKIYTEAQRLIRLVEDTLRLSRLDEGAEDMKWEPVDLYALAGQAIRSLAPEAQQANVQLQLSGSTAMVRGIQQLLSGILFNLCDNAIKYNRSGGQVTVTVENNDGSPTLTVRDTGIGIPAEHHSRIFERFYRVDKSHSKDVGGTGLGLSIVKHAAMILGAKIELQSAVGQGTSITVRFPPCK